MAPTADDRRGSFLERIGALLAPFPGRLEFAVRLALICAITTLVAEVYQTPEPALTAYVVFFVMKPDRMASVVTSIVMLLLISLILGLVLALTVQVIEQPLWRVTAMTLVSFCLTFAASASKLKPVAGTVALITAYALDLLGTVPGGELATRGILYVWLFVAIPAGVSIVVNLILGPAPRRLAERALARQLHLAGAVLRAPETGTRKAFEECLREGPGEIPEWLKLAGVERTSPPRDIAALQQAARSTIVILSVVDFLTDGPAPSLPDSILQRIARTLDGMAAILDQGGYPVEIELESRADETGLPPLEAAALSELRTALSAFAEPPQPDPAPQSAAKPKGGFFLPDAFTNPAHVHYALKTTGAAMFCYVVYLLLDWPGIHTCLITCYIVSLGTAAETVEKQALRFLGCGIGAAAGLAAIVFLMPNVTSIGGLDGRRLPGRSRLGLGRRRRPADLLCRLPTRLRLLPQRDPGRGARIRHDDRAGSDHRHPVRRCCRRDRLHADLAGDDCRTHQSGDRSLAASARRPGLGREHTTALGACRGSPNTARGPRTGARTHPL